MGSIACDNPSPAVCFIERRYQNRNLQLPRPLRSHPPAYRDGAEAEGEIGERFAGYVVLGIVPGAPRHRAATRRPQRPPFRWGRCFKGAVNSVVSWPKKNPPMTTISPARSRFDGRMADNRTISQLEAEVILWIGCECCKGTVWVPFKMLRERIPMLSAMTLDQLGAKMKGIRTAGTLCY